MKPRTTFAGSTQNIKLLSHLGFKVKVVNVGSSLGEGHW